MKSCLLNPIGTSPMIVTELYRYLRNVDPSLKDVIIIHTKNREVIQGSKAAVASLLTHYEDVRVQLKELKTDDIENSDELYAFLETVIDIMIEERDKYKVDRFYLNASGGIMILELEPVTPFIVKSGNKFALLDLYEDQGGLFRIDMEKFIENLKVEERDALPL